MKYVLAEDKKPIDGVDVYVVTEKGVKAVARYWALTGKWLTKDNNITQADVVKKWKYADAT